MRKLIAVKACHHKRAWVEAQKVTWVRDIVSKGYADVKFFFGTPRLIADRMPAPDERWLDVPDFYEGLPLKVKSICEWSAEKCYDFTMICDDDVYVAPERFPFLPLLADYTGRFRSPYGKVYPVHFASGFTQCLSNKAARIVADTPWNGDWMDERFLATTLARRGIFGYHDPVNYVVSGPHTVGLAVLNSETFRKGTVFCEYGPAAMHAMHLAFRNAKHVAPQPELVPMPHVVVTDEILASKPGDEIPSHKRGYYNGR